MRSVAGNFPDSAPGVPASGSSLMLAHALPKGSDDVAPTTRRFYLTSQRMDIKALAIRAWSDALTATFIKAGGKSPMPNEK
jgi:hypothetical protein